MCCEYGSQQLGGLERLLSQELEARYPSPEAKIIFLNTQVDSDSITSYRIPGAIRRYTFSPCAGCIIPKHGFSSSSLGNFLCLSSGLPASLAPSDTVISNRISAKPMKVKTSLLAMNRPGQIVVPPPKGLKLGSLDASRPP